MAAKLLLLRSLLRILTPDEINELSSSSMSSSRENLTDLLYENFFSEEIKQDKKIISLAEYKQEKNKKLESLESGEVTNSEDDASVEEVDNVTKEKDPAGKSNSLADFLFKEKEKLNKNNVKIKHKQILNLYKKNSELDIEQQKRFRDDLSKSSSTGVLVNKKQA